MTPTPAKIHAVCLFLALFCANAGAASRNAMPDVDGAVRALALATESGAATYAPLELRFATEQLDQARAAIASGDAKQARLLIDRAAANGDLALAKARLGRVREDSRAKAAQIAELKARLGVAPAVGERP